MTPIEQIQAWIQDKPNWWKHSIKLALDHGELEQKDLADIYKMARIEHKLESVTGITPPYTDQQIDFTGHTSEQEEVKLLSLSNVTGVGSLIADQTLNFSQEGLFIVYGDNGAGKSSYSSIMKHACLTRGTFPKILGNVFEPSPHSLPSATLSLLVNSRNEQHHWTSNSSSIQSLKAIRVFDTESSHHYVNKEDVLGFKPSGLNLLTELTKAISYVRDAVDKDLKSGQGLVQIRPLQSGTYVSQFLANISSNTKEDDVHALKATAEELAYIEPLRQEIAKDKLQTPESLRTNLNQQLLTVEPLQRFMLNTLRYLGDKAFDRLKELQKDYITKQRAADQIMQATLKGLPLESVTGINWQNLWRAARTFIESEPNSNNFPPIEGDYCPLCLQEISESSGERLGLLNKFLADNAAKDAAAAYNDFNNALRMISSQTLSLEDYKAGLEDANKLKPGIKDRITSLFEELKVRQKLFTTSLELPDIQSSLDVSSTTDIAALTQHLNEQIAKVKTNQDLTNLINKKEALLQELIDKKYILENSDPILQNIRQYRIVDKLSEIKRECNTRRVSDLSSTIYQQGVIEPITEAFSNELKQFGFTRFSVNVQTRNSGGHQQFKLSIANSGEPIVAKVASEGEQRCIAIAAFLAEMKADKRLSAIVFDDPVNSLSHQWSSKVAARLVKESLSRQVIVFTHDIVFFKLLLEQAEIHNALHSSLTLERSRQYSGIVRDSAPWEALTTSKRIKRLNTKLRGLRKTYLEDTETVFRQETQGFYGLLREAWERLVEEKLLNKVVNRFERGVYTQRLSRLVDISAADISVVDNAMSKCSTYFTGHDSAPAMGTPYPTIEEIESDLKAIQDFLDELQQNRKRT
ncbi:AAA family ATPase [Marinomonas ostreistagni]|uniref:AAA family ATPase n=1 Tax=Marinomonas ostreistagni TaxID=359209 RepID=UPI0019508206|nr:AAA family ATPase [Marinomonas ostreistagni]